MLHSEKWPYAATLLIAILGWHVSQLVEDIKSAQSVLYSVSSSTIRDGPNNGKSKIAVEIENVSRTQSLKQVQLTLACDAGVECLVPRTNYLSVHPPNAIRSQQPAADSNVVSITVTLAAGGELEFGAVWSGAGRRPQFLYVPNRDQPLNINFIDACSLRGIVVRHYFSIVFGSFVLALVLLGFIAIRTRRGTAAAGPPAEPGGDGFAGAEAVAQAARSAADQWKAAVAQETAKRDAAPKQGAPPA